MVSPGLRKDQLDALHGILRACALCPRQCRVDRTAGQKGFCGLAGRVTLSCALPHHGEEPPISGTRGAGTLFFSSCNLRCLFCQNVQISHGTPGRELDGPGLSEIMLGLQDRGCHNIELVTPTPHLPGILEALMIAAGRGLRVPVVFNSGGYENADVLRQLEGAVDVYLPDLKYGDDRTAQELSGAPDYARHAVAAIREMVRQTGDVLQMEGGLAVRGVIVRHLVLPGHLENSFAALRLLKDNVPPTVPLSLMSQYTPAAGAAARPGLDRRITAREYETALECALDLGFETVFVQEVDERNLVPDFELESPFPWQ